MEPAADQPRDGPAAPQEGGGQPQLHQQITIFNRLYTFPVINYILHGAVFIYIGVRNTIPISILTTLVAAEFTITKATSLALEAMKGDQVFLTADRFACGVLDWAFKENMARNTDVIAQYFMNYFSVVREGLFARIRHYIGVLVPTSENLRSCTYILCDTFYLAISNSIVLIFPSLGNVDNSIQNITTSYSQIPQRVQCLVNGLSVVHREELVVAVNHILLQAIHANDAGN